MNLVCDVATRNTSTADDPNGETYATCYVSIILRFERMERQTATERPAMDWADVVMIVGAYFALVQLLCWVASGLAWTDAVGR